MKPIIIETSDDNVLSIQKVQPYIDEDWALLPEEIVLLIEDENGHKGVSLPLKSVKPLIKALKKAKKYNGLKGFISIIKNK